MSTRALLIAVDHYYQSLRPLKGPIEDSREVKAWLEGQGVPRIDELVSVPGADLRSARPIGSEIEEWLDKLDAEADTAAAQGAGAFPLGERLYIFYGGHGIDAYTAGPSAVLPRTGGGRWDVFPFGPMARYLKARAYFREIIFLVDACREELDYSHDPTWNRRPRPSPNHHAVQTLFMNAAGAGQKTREIDFGENRWRGVLTQAFLCAVKGLASDGTAVTATRLKEVVINAVRAKIPEADPDINIPNQPMTIAQAPAVQPVIQVECQPGAEGPAVLRRDAGGESPIVLQPGINSFEVPLGSYQLVPAVGKPIDIHASWDINRVQAKPSTD